MKFRLAMFLLAVSFFAAGCAVEMNYRGRLLAGPYEGFRDKAEADQVAIARELLHEGHSDGDVIAALEARGLPEAEAKRVVILAYLAPPIAAAPKQ